MPSAFSAMQGGAALAGQFQPPAATPSNRAEGSNWTPTIVFHGDNDRTVNARNGDAIVEQVTVVGSDQQPLRANVQRERRREAAGTGKRDRISMDRPKGESGSASRVGNIVKSIPRVSN